MELEELRIRRRKYGKHEGTYEGSIAFNNKLGKVKLRLTHEHIDKLFIVCSDAVKSVAKDVSDELVSGISEHQLRISQADEEIAASLQEKKMKLGKEAINGLSHERILQLQEETMAKENRRRE